MPASGSAGIVRGTLFHLEVEHTWTSSVAGWKMRRTMHGRLLPLAGD